MEFGECLKTNYPYACWSNYVHKVIDNVQEVIQEGTLGSSSGEGNKAGNKIFRHLRKNHTRKSDTFESVTDVLQMQWFYCSHAFMSLSHVARNKYKCTKCGQTGHNSATCPSKNKNIMRKWLTVVFSKIHFHLTYNTIVMQILYNKLLTYSYMFTLLVFFYSLCKYTFLLV